MSGTGLPPKLRLDLSLVQKNDRTDNADKLPNPGVSEPPKVNTQNVANPGRSIRASFALGAQNLLNNEDDSDVELDLDIEQLPVIKAGEPTRKDTNPDLPAPVMQIGQLPVLDDDDDDEEGLPQEKNKLSILYDLILTPEQSEEPPDEWNYRTFIKELAKSEAAEDADDDDGLCEEDYYDEED